MEIGIGDDVEFRTDVQCELDRDSLEIIFQTCLTCYSESNVAVFVAAPVTKASANTCKPTKVASNVASPLIDTGEIEIQPVVVGVETEVEFETVSTKTFLIGKFSTIALTTAKTYTKSILCISCQTKAEYSNE